MSESAKPSCEQLINILPDPFVVIDKDYCIQAANQAYQDRYGVASGEVVGRRCYEVSHHSTVPCSQHGEHCPLEEVFSSGQPAQVMHLHRNAEGKEEYVQLQAAPILGHDNEVLFMGEYIRPVSQPADEDEVLIGRSGPMLRLLSILQRVAPTQTTVLLLGQSGVGKERVAEYIHHYSKRSSKPFHVLDCAALGANLIENELFGHEKSAYTGASQRKMGLFEIAHGGTLFIDEIGELPLALQTKLLRVLESGSIRRLGGTEYIDIDVRIVVATNRDLRAMVQRGDFREDLYYRLSAFPVKIPPLEERKDDIPALAEHFLSRIPEGDRHVPLSPEVIEALLSHHYPGNVRELRNIIERAVILAYDDTLRPEHLMFEGPGVPAIAASHNDKQVERDRVLIRRDKLNHDAVMQALQQCNGHRAQAAELLGVSERTLYRFLKQLKMGPD